LCDPEVCYPNTEIILIWRVHNRLKFWKSTGSLKYILCPNRVVEVMFFQIVNILKILNVKEISSSKLTDNIHGQCTNLQSTHVLY
jgi:hypothetical protein